MPGRYTEELLALPTQPAAAEQVLRLIGDRRSSAADLARVIETDLALAARVIRMANSPVYGAARRVANTQHAIVLLGFDTIRGLAASAACSLLDERTYLGPDGFWRHALGTAAASAAVARRVGWSVADAFSVGLLHDLGAVFLHRRDPELFEIAMSHATMSAQVAGEIAGFGETHAQAGAAALDAWGFPPAFVEAVALHQHGVEEPQYALGRILQVGEAIALDREPIPGYPGDRDIERLLRWMGLSPAQLDEMHGEMEDNLARLADSLGARA